MAPCDERRKKAAAERTRGSDMARAAEQQASRSVPRRGLNKKKRNSLRFCDRTKRARKMPVRERIKKVMVIPLKEANGEFILPEQRWHLKGTSNPSILDLRKR